MSDDIGKLTRPVVGIENRTAQEVFDIMCDRFRLRARREREPVVKALNDCLEMLSRFVHSTSDDAKHADGRRVIRASYAAITGTPILTAGCCSAISPCAHQRKDPATICDTCANAALGK